MRETPVREFLLESLNDKNPDHPVEPLISRHYNVAIHEALLTMFLFSLVALLLGKGKIIGQGVCCGIHMILQILVCSQVVCGSFSSIMKSLLGQRTSL